MNIKYNNYIAAVLFLLQLSCNVISSSNVSADSRQSLDFLLPNAFDALGAKCLKLSRYFCLLRFWIDSKQSDRLPQKDDREEFERLVRPVYADLNWFSLWEKDVSSGDCCSFQVDTYIHYGQKYGLSPSEYHQQIFHLDSIWSKQLVFLKVIWNKVLCMNVVTQIGYGSGQLRIVGGKDHSKSFMISPGGEDYPVFSIPGNQVRGTLTFAWFVLNCMCKEKPKLCPDFVFAPAENVPSRAMNKKSKTTGNQ
ncbi:uncharacterized protein LOC142349494 [Convolutriloba macropyga]|uniref:uncharacterized protein LOC142349494 n=1 Tax=Convolutriloba macropyga TaxID=536237 RepID=UPI003F5243F3